MQRIKIEIVTDKGTDVLQSLFEKDIGIITSGECDREFDDGSKIELPKDYSINEGFGLYESIPLILTFTAGVASQVLASWIYDKIKASDEYAKSTYREHQIPINSLIDFTKELNRILQFEAPYTTKEKKAKQKRMPKTPTVVSGGRNIPAPSTTKESCNSKPEIDELETLKILHDEWKFRVTYFWKISIKFYFANLILTLLPLIHGIWDVDLIYFGIPLWIFPILGMLASLVITIVAGVEINTIRDIDKQICLLVNETLKNKKPTNNWYLAYPIIICSMQFVISFTILHFIMRIA